MHRFWISITMVLVAFHLWLPTATGNAEERIESAYLNAVGQLVIVVKVDNFGTVENFYTVIFHAKNPTFCNFSDKRYVIYTQDYLVVDREPTLKKLCPEWDFVKRRCKR